MGEARATPTMSPVGSSSASIYNEGNGLLPEGDELFLN